MVETVDESEREEGDEEIKVLPVDDEPQDPEDSGNNLGGEPSTGGGGQAPAAGGAAAAEQAPAESAEDAEPDAKKPTAAMDPANG